MLLQILVNGVLAGLIYVIMALGFTLVFGIMRIVNFAHGEFYMVGALSVLLLYGMLGVPFFLAVLLGGVIACLLGLVMERFLIRPIVSSEMHGMIMTLAVGIVLQSGALMILGPNELSVPRPITGTFGFLGATIPLDRAVVAASALLILAGFYLTLKYTRIGLAMQAVAQDRFTASLMGIEENKIFAISFAASCMMAGLAGALMAPVFTIGPYMGEMAVMKAFVIVILGGLGSIPGAVIGGLLIGLSESFLSIAFNSTTATLASFGIVLVIVILKPTGLMGRSS